MGRVREEGTRSTRISFIVDQGKPRPLYSGFKRCHCTMVCLGFVIISCQCFVSLAPLPFFPGKEFTKWIHWTPDSNFPSLFVPTMFRRLIDKRKKNASLFWLKKKKFRIFFNRRQIANVEILDSTNSSRRMTCLINICRNKLYNLGIWNFFQITEKYNR